MKQQKKWRKLAIASMSGLLIAGLVAPTFAHAAPVTNKAQTNGANALKSTIQDKNLVQDPNFTSFTNDKDTGWVYMSQVGMGNATNMPLIPNGGGYDIQNSTNDHLLGYTEHVDINGEAGVQVDNKPTSTATYVYVQQKVTNLIPGQTYHLTADYRLLSSDLDNPAGSPYKPNVLALIVDNAGDQQLVKQDELDNTDNEWRTYDYTFQAGGTEAELAFLSFARTVDFAEQSKMTTQYKNVKLINADQLPPDVPTINDLTTESTSATGKAEPNSDITLTVNGEVIGTGKTDDDGNYTVAITPQPANAVVQATATDTAGNVSDPASTVVASLNNSAIGGTVTDDATGNGLPNTRVELHDVDGNLLDFQQTDSNGQYNFTGLASGNYYTKVIIPSDYEYVTGNGYGSDGNSNYIQLDGENKITDYNITLGKKEPLNTVDWIYNKDASNNRVIADGDNISVYDNYTDAYNNHNLNFDLKDSDGNALDPRNYTITSSNTSVAKIILGNNGALLYAATIEGPGTSVITIKDSKGNTIRQYTINIHASVQDVKWNYNKDGISRPVNTNGVLEIPNTYMNQYNTPHVDLQFYNSAGKLVQPKGYTVTFSDPSIATADQSDPNLIALVHNQKTGSTNVTIRDEQGNVVRSFTFTVTAPAVAATDINLSTTNINTTVNATGKINATVSPANATNKTLSYTPADPSIITVDANGNWTAKKAGTTTIAVKTTDGSNITKTVNVTVTDPNAIASVKWNFNKDGVSRPVNNNGILEIPNTYMNQYNKPHVDLQFYNSAGALVQPKGYTVSFSDPTIARADQSDPNLIALVHNDKAGSTNVTIRDAQGNVVRSFTFTVTGKSIADRLKSADVELVNNRPNAGSTGTNAYIYPHVADVPAGVTYSIETYNTKTGAFFSNIVVGTTDGTYHQVLHNTANPTAAWAQGMTIKVYATYQGVKYLVLEGPSSNYYSVQTTHVWKD
ncbi:Ig-like domain-containing protein [Listeria riparia]|uniref:BIG2 domain-containing protein n=1 Tax=Listeria riparia FSL S10-1204 TaxID=1265816 RepID=W7DJL9_9LIST|nr:Ig-like domain-containing protein [Listeria riparia]EUJ45548.1 hypothetical protein PRIP_06818 [Listeria riparia FSL S10-1204]